MKMPVATIATAFALSLMNVPPARAQDAPATGDEKTQPKPPEANPPEPKPDQAELDKQFEKTMSGATLVGHFTVEGRGAGREPGEDRYHINKVTKLRGDYWLFTARVQYGKKDVTVPMPLQVKWAGDTAVITLTDMAIPGLGTYTARVLIFRDHYAGYWSGGDHGGNLWGRIEHDEQPAADAPGAPKAPDAPAQPEPGK
jgi:hypothetical protein